MTFRQNLGGCTPPVPTSGRYVFGSRSMKSKIPCRAGPVPVANVVHATGDCGGFVEASGR
jgi:hypothetical protein